MCGSNKFCGLRSGRCELLLQLLGIHEGMTSDRIMSVLCVVGEGVERPVWGTE
jgi:hypothetical protein